MPAQNANTKIASLSKSYWEGQRWIVSYKVGPAWHHKLFDHYSKADLFASEMAQFSPRITLLSDLLRTINKPRVLPPIASIEEIQMALSLHPISGIDRETTLASILATGNPSPCYWIRSILPITAASKYEISTSAKTGANELKRTKTIFKADHFHTVMPVFEKLVKEGNANTRYTLSAILRSDILSEKLILYESENRSIRQVRDPIDVEEIQQPLFVKYNPSRRMLQFYDDGIRRIYPWKMKERFSFMYYNPDPKKVIECFLF